MRQRRLFPRGLLSSEQGELHLVLWELQQSSIPCLAFFKVKPYVTTCHGKWPFSSSPLITIPLDYTHSQELQKRVCLVSALTGTTQHVLTLTLHLLLWPHPHWSFFRPVHSQWTPPGPTSTRDCRAAFPKVSLRSLQDTDEIYTERNLQLYFVSDQYSFPSSPFW